MADGAVRRCCFLALHVTADCVFILTHKWGVNDPNVAPEAPTSDEPDGDSR